ncbi:hypothetical protein BJ508DRAFT_90845 [Ascobolus immersus RN42]|uniref:Uncharacterized protein n=1 Tax=Ascobolus immersus RN42 TaxID=1160509 RepID=A0A3N4IA41_ASCIM|nr:hypothetical protein BJ508DRAFT_90845 [Ascobolus immersus RN42]
MSYWQDTCRSGMRVRYREVDKTVRNNPLPWPTFFRPTLTTFTQPLPALHSLASTLLTTLQAYARASINTDRKDSNTAKQSHYTTLDSTLSYHLDRLSILLRNAKLNNLTPPPPALNSSRSKWPATSATSSSSPRSSCPRQSTRS